MAYVIVDRCIGTKDGSCIEVCPVDCIHPTPDEPGYPEAEQLYIDPEECIDCDGCATACPVEAPVSEELLPPGLESFRDKNAAYFRGRHDGGDRS